MPSRRINTSIEITAPPSAVWAVLTDFQRYAEWNPFIIEIGGERRVGGRLRVRLRPPGGPASTFAPTVLAFDPERELRWIGHAFAPGLFDGEHAFRLESADGGSTRFVQSESFSGLLVPLLSGMLPNVQRGFEAMNAALKGRAEAR
jgi:hypothetical protein